MIDRRSFVRRSWAGAGSLWLAPALLARLGVSIQPAGSRLPAAAAPSQDPAPGLLAAAVRRALGEGKPLLVFVVPAAGGSDGSRGQRLGAMLDGDAGAALDVAMTVPVCATLAELRAALPPCEVAGEPLFVLVRLARAAEGTPTVEQVTAVADPDPRVALVGPLTTDDAAVDPAAQGDRSLLADALHEAVLPDLDSLARLVVRATAALDAARRAALDRWLDGDAAALGDDAARDGVLVAAAAIVRSMAATLPDTRRDEVLATLATAVSRVVVHRALPGSVWARTSGCGIEYEGPVPGDVGLQVECGMGSVPEQSRRFLHFLTAK